MSEMEIVFDKALSEQMDAMNNNERIEAELIQAAGAVIEHHSKKIPTDANKLKIDGKWTHGVLEYMLKTYIPWLKRTHKYDAHNPGIYNYMQKYRDLKIQYNKSLDKFLDAAREVAALKQIHDYSNRYGKHSSDSSGQPESGGATDGYRLPWLKL